jgi:hypothetical protein
MAAVQKNDDTSVNKVAVTLSNKPAGLLRRGADKSLAFPIS